MSFDAISNRGEYLSAHYLAAVLPETLKRGLLKKWAEEQRDGRVTPRVSLRRFRGDFFDAKAEFSDLAFADHDRLRKHHQEVLRAFGFDPQPQTIAIERNGRDYEIPVAHAEISVGHGVIAIDCGWATDTDAAHESDGAALLLDPITLDRGETIASGAKLAAWLFGTEQPPRYVLLLNGGVVTLADRSAWGEGRYLAVSLDIAYGRNEDRELDLVAALFGADSLRPPAEGGTEPLADLVARSRQHAVGVSSELRDGLRTSVELIANEVLDRIRDAGYQPHEVMDLDELSKELGREALRYLYRILFLLYAEARPELGVLPVNDPEYSAGYSLARLGDLIARRLNPSTLRNYHLYESLDLLFELVNKGHRPRAGAATADSEELGLRFEPMRSDLFLPEAIKLIGRQIPQPGAEPDDPNSPKLDTRLRDATLYQVLRLLMLTKGDKHKRGGFISYAQLGINQLGAVYEGLMSYTGFVATEALFEVAKNGESSGGSWMIPASKVAEYDESVFVSRQDPVTFAPTRREYQAGQFVYRLAGRDRQTSASYYTPQSLTEVTVGLALMHRLDQDGTTTVARELLNWTICEPALGSGAFLNEAINQIAIEYMRRRQQELQRGPEDYQAELQKVKAYIALHNCYGVDLNRTAVELAEVSLWLNVMHSGLQAPWFGLHLRRGNSLIGCRRQVYAPKQLNDKTWLTITPTDTPFREGPVPSGSVHHFLLPAEGWGAAATEREARELTSANAEALKKWRANIKRSPATKKARGQASQVERLQGLARRVEYLWNLVQQRLTISEREIRRHIDVWEAESLPVINTAVPREKILADLEAPGTPYWRLKTLMDTWCAFWFWPLGATGLLNGSAEIFNAGSANVTHEKTVDVYEEPTVFVKQDLFGEESAHQLSLPRKIGNKKITLIEQLKQQTPLANLDDWLTFAEALMGRADFPQDSLLEPLDSLAALDRHEEILLAAMGMDEPYRLGERFPWLDMAVRIADEQGFFHWELTFAQAFCASSGGFDIQVGNPPWVRPDWDEAANLSDVEPWFALADNPDAAIWQERKLRVLADGHVDKYLARMASQSAVNAFFRSPATYPLLAGTRPDLYRAFMCHVWARQSLSGVAGLVHPDTHFGGVKEGPLRAAAYEHLRFHAHFHNRRGVFAEIHANTEFGIHIYGKQSAVHFDHVSWLFDPNTLVESLVHDGVGDLPGIKYNGTWEVRPHKARLITVDEEVLARWQQLSSDTSVPVRETTLLYPVTTSEQAAMEALIDVERRLGSELPKVTVGMFENLATKKLGLYRWDTSQAQAWEEVILQGPHIGVATPLNKQPNNPCRTNRDWSSFDLRTLPEDSIPRTNYVRACDKKRFDAAQDIWDGQPSTNFYRLAWRRMIPFDTERSLFAALVPPGPAHIDGIHSMKLSGNLETALASGFWAALPLDYLLRITSRADLRVAEVAKMPAADPQHPLASPLLLRALRLNCLSTAYKPIWAELFDARWSTEDWAVNWPLLDPIGLNPGRDWAPATPLRTEYERRAALVELDALVSVWLGITADGLVAMFRSRYPILADYEAQTWFDANGRKISGNHNTYGFGQTKEHYLQLVAHLEHDALVPDGYAAEFYKADREREYREAHAFFSKRLKLATGTTRRHK